MKAVTSQKADTQQIKRLLKVCNFTEIFTRELGWDTTPETSPTITYKGQDYEFKYIAQKRGFKIYQLTFDERIPDRATLVQLDKPLDDYAAAHLTIYVDASRENQAWLWVKRKLEKDRQRAEPRLHRYNRNQNGESLTQKIERLFVGLDEEEHITLTSILDRVTQGFDVEKVTKRFYELFKTQHGKFMDHIEHITDKDDREWYTSIMLNRLMFVYFIQRKKILNNHSSVSFDGDDDYLEKRLELIKQEDGPDKFYAFYRHFLRRLFHDGLNRPQEEHSPELEKIIGRVPHINGGIFDVHELERKYPDIKIKDEAFEKLFEFFRKFDWHLDNNPTRDDDEINPDVLGYIFEKYINQKEMGAYYTKEDITGYISKNTIIPFIFEKVAQTPDAFVADGPVWSLLRAHPDKYIYEDVVYGTLEELPQDIEAGIADVAQRTNWNKTADDRWGLLTETWREVVERRRRYTEVHEKISRGEINTINDLITYNLNITQFASDVIAACEKPDLLRVFYDALRQVTVLDPTCGSGAFLFAALNILQPLYQTCIERMRELVNTYDSLLDWLRNEGDRKQIDRFRNILQDIDQHEKQEYFILKSIMVNNLYGVDIMEEAIEICKLRLFLKLVAQIETPDELEPLPDIDFNVLAGNTLIGFTSMEEIRRVANQKLLSVDDTEGMLARIELLAKEIERDTRHFRAIQTDLGVRIDHADKQRLRDKLDELRKMLDPYLATEYGIYKAKQREKYEEEYGAWKKSHKPFHWWMEFYEIMENGGFDVIIGNPPYVERSEFKKSGYIPKGFKTERCSDIYAMFLERAIKLIGKEGLTGVIIPISFICADDFAPLQDLILKKSCVKWTAHFANRPSQLFVGAQKRLTILIMDAEGKNQNTLFTSRYNRWIKEERDSLLSTTEYISQDCLPIVFKHSLAKIGSELEHNIVKKAFSPDKRIGTYTLKNTPYKMYYVRTPGYFCQFLKFPPMTIKLSTQETKPRGELYCDTFKTEDELYLCMAIVNSNLFCWYFTVYSDCRHMNRRDVLNFPFDLNKLNSEARETLIQFSKRLQEDYLKNKSFMNKSGLRIETFRAEKSKPIIDEIDRVLAQHYGFTPEELDFIINYDIKYRMGRDNGDESEE